MKNSFLSLVGAGPGDPGLITLKAVNTLQVADVILYDALVNEQLLSYAGPDCLAVFVGKRAGCPCAAQREINELIVQYARSHGHVVRLKGGDPFVFGRAQEELAAARAAGIEYEVIPGISSALAVPALMGIPPTCRGISESFWVITGTTRSGEISEDIYLAAKSSATIILLMAMKKLELIMDLFLEAGKQMTPVAIIQNGSTEAEKMITGTVLNICSLAKFEKLSNPAVIIIGYVVGLHKYNKIKNVIKKHQEMDK